MKAENLSKKKTFAKITVTVVTVIFVLLIVADLTISNYLVNYAIGRAGDGGKRTVSAPVQQNKTEVQKTVDANRDIQYAKNDAWLEKKDFSETQIISADNLKLQGYFMEQDNPSNLWLIAIHGYRSNHTEMISTACNYFEHNFNVLLPDLRACGKSEGKYVGMGWLDRKDILKWIDWILIKNPEAKIVIHGESMGGATTMMVSGEETPNNVVAFVEDCGYSSVWDIFSDELKLRFHLPSFPLMNTANIISKAKAGYSFSEASSVEQLKKSTKPMLFIHGDADDFVTFPNLERVYEAKAGTNKQKFVVHGAGHCRSAFLVMEDYWQQVFSFLEQYL